MKLSVVAAAVAFLSVAACSAGSPTLDTSSQEAYQRSVAAISTTLPEADRARFGAALLSLMMADAGESDNPLAALTAMAQTASEPGAMLAKLGPLVGGKSGTEILVMADDLAATRLARQLKALDDRIAALEAVLRADAADAASGQLVLDKFAIAGARYYWSDSGYMREPAVSFSITNGSTIAIRKIMVDAIVETPGRSVPWIEAAFNYEFPGGLEPGESKQLDLAPNRFMDGWGNSDLQDRSDLLTTLTLTGVEDASGKILGRDASTGSQGTESELEALKAQRSALAAAAAPAQQS